MRRRVLDGLFVGAAVLAIVAMEAVGFAATAPAERSSVSWLIVHTLVGLVFAVCAFVSWRVGESRAPGRIMLAVALLWIPQPLYAAIGGWPTVWPIVASVDLLWALLAGLLVLVYHSGRLSGPLDRMIVIVAILLSSLRVGATIVLHRTDARVASPNPFAVVPNEALYDAIDIGYRLLGVALVLVIAVRVVARWFRGSGPARNVAFVMPIALFAWAATLVYVAVAFAFDLPTIELLDYVSLLSLATIPLAFVAGLLFVQSLRGRVADLMVITRDGADRSVWEQRLGQTLRDPSVRVAWWDDADGRYHDARGEPVDPFAPVRADRAPGAAGQGAAGGSLLRIDSPDGPIAVVRHDSVLTDNTKLLDAASTALRLSIDNGRLRSELERTLDDVRESRLRIVQAGDEARKRLERDLHDGSQQQLVSLAIALRMTRASAAAAGADAVATELDQASALLTTALRELREFARGIHPTASTEGGLDAAIPELAGRCPVPVELDLAVGRRLPTLVESTVYFLVAECLTNVAKYAQARRCWLRVRVEGGVVTVSVRDNGSGGADVDAGSGLRGMADRVAAVSGSIEVRSPLGEGTTVTARIPVAVD